MQSVTPTARHYDRVTILFHWITVVLVTEQWLGAQIIDWFPRGPLRVDARSVHITLGVVLALTIAARLMWRATGGRRLPQADDGALNLLAKATHWGLNALLIAMVLVGMALAWTRGDSLFNLFSIPAYDPGNKPLAESIGSIHETIGWIIVGLAGLHAAAALTHQFLWRDHVLARMIPQIKL